MGSDSAVFGNYVKIKCGWVQDSEQCGFGCGDFRRDFNPFHRSSDPIPVSRGGLGSILWGDWGSEINGTLTSY